MNVAETLRGLLRRWYIVIPGLILAVAVAIGAWIVVKPGYERTATQLLIPGQLSLPENANPFLFLGGLSNAADVLVRAIASEGVLNDVLKDQPGAEVAVTRDGLTSGPVILITVTGRSDAQAESVLAALVERTSVELEELQDAERIAADNRITVMPITVDDVSILQQRDRLVASVGVGVLVVVITVIFASLVDGLGRQGRRRSSRDTDSDDEQVEAEDDPLEAETADEFPADSVHDSVSATDHDGNVDLEDLIAASEQSSAPRGRLPSKPRRM